jgi:uncharacterized membrane protein (UPF0182 family)
MKITKEHISTLVRRTLQRTQEALREEKAGIVTTGDPEVDRVAYYLEQINDRQEMKLAIPLMFRKIMQYGEHNITTSEFHAALLEAFGKDDAHTLFSILSRVDIEEIAGMGDEDEADDGEKPQTKKDKEHERLAAEDPEASDREDRGAKYAQSLDDRDHESKEAKEKKEGLNRAFNKGLFSRALKEALRSRNEN